MSKIMIISDPNKYVFGAYFRTPFESLFGTPVLSFSWVDGVSKWVLKASGFLNTINSLIDFEATRDFPRDWKKNIYPVAKCLSPSR